MKDKNNSIYSIPELKVCRFPKHIIFFDTEYFTKVRTKNGEYKQTLDIVCFIHRQFNYQNNTYTDETQYFTNTTDIHKYLIKKLKTYRKIVTMAHNSDGDLFVIDFFKFINKHKMKNKIWYVKGLAKILSFKNQKYEFNEIDTMNYFQVGVDSLGKMLNSKKIKINFKKHSKENLKKYVYQDTKIIADSITKLIFWLKKEDLGSFGYTISSIAFSIYRHKFMKIKIYIDNKRSSIPDENKSYHGGRTENFFIGKKVNIKQAYIDANSMYPDIMRNKKLPVNYKKSIKNVKVKDLEYYLKRYCCIADVNLDTVKNAYPKKVNDKIIFPVGKINTVLTHAELEYALKNNDIVKINNLHIYISGYLFTDFVDYFYKKRLDAKKNNDIVMSYFYKIIMNSLYGKFGQKLSKYVKVKSFVKGIFGSYFKRDTKSNTMKLHYIINGDHFRVDEGEPSKFNFLPIASTITGYARIKLFETIERIGIDDVSYCDTDSIIFNHNKLYKIKDILDNNKLGYWKLVKIIKNSEFRTSKDYVLDGVETLKGVTKNSKKINENLYTFLKFKRISQIFRNSNNDYMTITNDKKFITHKFDKGLIQKDGKVKPFTFNDF